MKNIAIDTLSLETVKIKVKNKDDFFGRDSNINYLVI